MIPKNITREHVLRAIREIERDGVPAARKSRKFPLRHDGKAYPSKYVISLANKYANGAELNPSEFSGGRESTKFLAALGFSVGEASSSTDSAREVARQAAKPWRAGARQHDERCKACKAAVQNLLNIIYGRVEKNYKFQVGTRPEDFKDTAYYGSLKAIYQVLQSHRGFYEFVKSETLPHCDFFVPNPGFIVEFDESQHYTLPRKIALEKYPAELSLGFSRGKWVLLCEELSKRDDEPPYRDEQRAWYDTLRDFVAPVKGLKPTVRLYARDLQWCGLDPGNSSDIARFKGMVEGNKGEWRLEVKTDSNPSLARIVIDGEWEGAVTSARKLLEEVCERWPRGVKVHCLVTCGAFLRFGWPKPLPHIGDNRHPNDDAVESLMSKGQELCDQLLEDHLVDKLKKCTDFLTLGVDSAKRKISTTQNVISEPHVELVCVVDLGGRKFHWTGKSYPTPGQERALVRITDLGSHFVETDRGKIIILGCHDLTIYNPRSKNAKGWRREARNNFRELALKEEPTYVLHHPHTTVKSRTWLNAWNGLRKALPSVKMVCRGRKLLSERRWLVEAQQHSLRARKY